MEFKNEYAFLSNMFSCDIHYDDQVFPCVETAFQYAKCAKEKDRELFLTKSGIWCHGLVARKIGRQVETRPDWNEYRLDVMYKLLEDKFYHNERLRKALCNTNNIYISEDNTYGDKFWGVCNGEGFNMLGRMIMEIRQDIQKTDRKRKVIVAGTRSFNDYEFLKKQLDYYFSCINPTVVCGEARGADTLGKRYANENKIPVLSFPADWSKGRNAGYVRNEKMAKEADCLIAFWDGKSHGTKHMIETMRKLNKPVRVIKY